MNYYNKIKIYYIDSNIKNASDKQIEEYIDKSILIYEK